MKNIEQYNRDVNNLAKCRFNDLIKNGGLPYAAILMSVLFKHCNGIARIYCQGFKPELVCQEPFWYEFCKYLKNPNNKLYALIDTTQWINQQPMTLLKWVKEDRAKTEQIEYWQRRKDGTGKRKKLKKVKDIIIPDSSIVVKLINKKSANYITDRYGEKIHFSVFDNEKYRYEYDSENYKAYGSFNQPKTSQQLIDTFDMVFNDPTSKIII